MEQKYDGLTKSDWLLLWKQHNTYEGLASPADLDSYLDILATLLRLRRLDPTDPDWLIYQSDVQRLEYEVRIRERQFKSNAAFDSRSMERLRRDRSPRFVGGNKVLLAEVDAESNGCGYIGVQGWRCLMIPDSLTTVLCRVCGPIRVELCERCLTSVLRYFDATDEDDMVRQLRCISKLPGLHEVLSVDEVTFH